MDLQKLVEKKHFYFLGIGGIGMSALARYFNVIGRTVGGYDKTPSALTQSLTDEEIGINYEDDCSIIPNIFKAKGDVLVVRTPAVPEDNKQLQWFKENGFDICKIQINK